MIELILMALLALVVIFIVVPILMIVLTAVLGVFVVTEVSDSIPDIERSNPRNSSSKSNPPPILSVAKAVRLRMPTTYPFRRVDHAWPPFQGIRVELGGDRDG